MTEVWKSQGRKFCEMCKVWFGDNKASIEHHERGMKHQAMVKQKLRDLGKANTKKAHDQAALNATLAQMEAAAAASMSRNNEGVVNGPALPERGLGIGPKIPVGGTKYLDPRQMSMQSMAMEMARRKKEEEERKAQLAATVKSSLWREDEPEETAPLPKDDPSEILWVEADAEDGRKYYYHMFSGAVSWEIPDRFFTQKEYDRRLAEIEQRAIDRAKQGLPTDPSQKTIVNTRGEEVAAPPPLQVAKRKVARDEAEIEAELEAKAKAARLAEEQQSVPAYYGSGTVPESEGAGPAMPAAPKFTAMPERSGPSIFATRKERRKELRKQEPGEGSAMDCSLPYEIPLPPMPPSGGSTSFSASSGATYHTGAIPLPPEPPTVSHAYVAKEEAIGERIAPAPFKKEEEQEFKEEVEEEEGDEGQGNTVADEVMKMAANTTPFGAWTKVAHDPLAQPYVKPVTEEQRKADERAARWREREAEESTTKAPKKVEAKIEFTEKVAPILTKKKNVGPVEFKKRSAPKSVRRREDE